MKDLTQKFSIESYIDKNREKIDESLVSLRIMKEVDRFLDYENLSNKDLATKLGYSESYISQLMSGVKNVNISFINKFEKSFKTKFDFKIYLNNEKTFLHKLEERIQFNTGTHFNFLTINGIQEKRSYNLKSKSMLEIIDVEYETLSL